MGHVLLLKLASAVSSTWTGFDRFGRCRPAGQLHTKLSAQATERICVSPDWRGCIL